jgi:hypothetical protein
MNLCDLFVIGSEEFVRKQKTFASRERTRSASQVHSVVVSYRVGGFELARMHLYNLTLQTPTASLQAIVGNFSGARQQEIIISHGTRLQLLRPDIQTGKLSTIIETEVFGSIRSLAAFRLTGGTKGKLL